MFRMRESRRYAALMTISIAGLVLSHWSTSIGG